MDSVIEKNSFIQSVYKINCNLVPSGDPSTIEFVFKLIKNVCDHILSNGMDQELLEELKNVIIHNDVKYFVLKALLHLFKDKKKLGDETEDFVTNGFDLLVLVQIKESKSLKSTLFFKSDEDNLIPKSCLTYKKQAELFASVWFTFLSFKLTVPIYKKVLQILEKKVMPHFRNPLCLSDFLISSFNIGGSASLLSLSSLFILMTKCNLDYPDFYKKFYNLITPDMLYVKYRARFFYWTDIFLTSTHIPAYLIAAFIKKLARLTLVAPVDAIQIILPIIKNILIRHPSLSSMVNKYQPTTMDSDPYDCNQEDPAKSNAIESSLWEVKTLAAHWDPKVVKAASFINRPLPTLEVDLADILETSFNDIKEEVENSIDHEDFDLQVNNLRDPIRKFLQC
ncbi:nucleolar complex protein 4 homolog [Tetranychus urticae]|uniref:CCAAT-binding factor domain-containing protein n=1 Tax=Tetranychus urticae TaxID=32264 RepID=T1KXB0_TETUR|nr:nucleolar complex protein 4 homolog [Tetranychus urticae]